MRFWSFRRAQAAVIESPYQLRRGVFPWPSVALLAAFALAATSSGCIVTSDLPDPALDIPGAYKAATSSVDDMPPSLDWWRSFRSKELTVLMEEAQTVNLDTAAAVARIRQADAQAQITGAALLPSVTGSFSGSRSRSSRGSRRRRRSP